MNEYCGIEVERWAKILSIFGLVLSVGSLILCLTSLVYLPMSISHIVAFILVLNGIKNKNRKFLITANVILALNTLFQVILTGVFFYMGIALPQKLKDAVNKLRSNGENASDDEMRVICFLLGLGCLFITALQMFAFFVIHKTQQYWFKNERNTLELPLTVNGISSNLPPIELIIPNPPPPNYDNGEFIQPQQFGGNQYTNRSDRLKIPNSSVATENKADDLVHISDHQSTKF